MAENIVGIKYIGGKPQKVDNVANTGATWKPGDVVNFSSSVAALLLVHASIFEIAEVNPSAPTFMGNGKKSDGKQQEPVAFANISGMDAKQLDAYSRLNFNRGIDLNADIAVSRNIVLGYMSNATLDEEAERLASQATSNGNQIISIEVSEPEYEAYVHGILALRLVPVSTGSTNDNIDIVITPETEGTLIGVAGEPVVNLDATQDSPIEPKQIETQENTEAPADALPSLTELIAKLDKKGLVTLGKENGVGVSNTMTEDKLREKLLAELVK